jgi:charged multivesicular body protein 2A
MRWRAANKRLMHSGSLRQDKKVLTDIKKMVKQNQMVRGGTTSIFAAAECRRVQDAAKIMTKDLVRTRRYARKFMLMRAQLQAVSLRIQVIDYAKPAECGRLP